MKKTSILFFVLCTVFSVFSENEFGFKFNQFYLNVFNKKTNSPAPIEFAYKFTVDYSKRIHKDFME